LWIFIGIKVCGSSSRLLKLLEARGAQAIVEAAQKATKFEMQGQNEQAQTWRQIEAALKLMRGPHQK
jgi:hypothetical protein